MWGRLLIGVSMHVRKQCYGCDKWFTTKTDTPALEYFCDACLIEQEEIKDAARAKKQIEGAVARKATLRVVRSDSGEILRSRMGDSGLVGQADEYTKPLRDAEITGGDG